MHQRARSVYSQTSCPFSDGTVLPLTAQELRNRWTKLKVNARKTTDIAAAQCEDLRWRSSQLGPIAFPGYCVDQKNSGLTVALASPLADPRVPQPAVVHLRSLFEFPANGSTILAPFDR